MEPINTSLRYRSRENITERLRTQRVQCGVPVLVRGTVGNRSFEEATQSVSVNAYGGVVRLSAQVVLAQQISIFNLETAKELPGMVTFVGLKCAGKRDIAIEFSEISVPFWGVAFPGWNRFERKRRPHIFLGQM